MAAILQNGCMMVDGMFISIEKPDKSLYIMLIGIVLEVIAIFIMEYNLHVVNSVYYVLLIGSALQVPIYYILFKKDLREFLNRKRAEDKNLNEDAC